MNFLTINEFINKNYVDGKNKIIINLLTNNLKFDDIKSGKKLDIDGHSIKFDFEDHENMTDLAELFFLN